jgi:hypothetical protein
MNKRGCKVNNRSYSHQTKPSTQRLNNLTKPQLYITKPSTQ